MSSPPAVGGCSFFSKVPAVRSWSVICMVVSPPRVWLDLVWSGDELIKDWLDKGLMKRLKDLRRNRTEEERLGDRLTGSRLTTV